MFFDMIQVLCKLIPAFDHSSRLSLNIFQVARVVDSAWAADFFVKLSSMRVKLACRRGHTGTIRTWRQRTRAIADDLVDVLRGAF